VQFELIGEISVVETIARGPGLRIRSQLQQAYGYGAWRKRKGVGAVRLVNGSIRIAELHWYEAHGTGRKLMKIKRFLD
jgi:hypothetical protein